MILTSMQPTIYCYQMPTYYLIIYHLMGLQVHDQNLEALPTHTIWKKGLNTVLWLIMLFITDFEYSSASSYTLGNFL